MKTQIAIIKDVKVFRIECPAAKGLQWRPGDERGFRYRRAGRRDVSRKARAGDGTDRRKGL